MGYLHFLEQSLYFHIMNLDVSLGNWSRWIVKSQHIGKCRPWYEIVFQYSTTEPPPIYALFEDLNPP